MSRVGPVGPSGPRLQAQAYRTQVGLVGLPLKGGRLHLAHLPRVRSANVGTPLKAHLATSDHAGLNRPLTTAIEIVHGVLQNQKLRHEAIQTAPLLADCHVNRKSSLLAPRESQR